MKSEWQQFFELLLKKFLKAFYFISKFKMGPKTPKKTPSKPKEAATDPVQSTSAGPDQPVPDPAPDVIDVSDEEEEKEIDLWTFYEKDPKFKPVKDPKDPKKKQYPDAICNRCKHPVPRTDAGTKGMRQHLEHRHHKSWETLLAAEAKKAKAKVWIVELLSMLLSFEFLSFPSIYPDFPRLIPTALE